MRILYLTQYFPPEVGATQTRAFEMARHLVQKGHDVTVLTELPNHPSGVVHPDFRRKLFVRRKLEGIDVIHGWVKASPKKTLSTRLLLYFSYMFSAFILGMLVARRRYDAIYCTSPPLFAGGAGLALSILRRTPFFFEVRDLWPESAVALGELSSPVAIRLSYWLAQACYKRSMKIIAVTEGVRQGIISAGANPGKVALIPNGANVDLFRANKETAHRVRSELGVSPDSFVLVYAGILGLAYSLETVIEAAVALQDRPEFTFWIIGAGPRAEDLRRLGAKHSLTNLFFLGEKRYEELPAYLSAANVALIPLRKLTLFDGTLPVKMFDAWACETPTILAVNAGESREVTETAGGGVVIPPEDSFALVRQIEALAANPTLAAAMGTHGRRFVVDHFSRQAQANQLAQLLASTLRSNRETHS